jgi:hypothetical protein
MGKLTTKAFCGILCDISISKKIEKKFSGDKRK